MSDEAGSRTLQVVRVQGDAKPEFCNNFVIQADGAEFHIRFYQVLPPVVVGATVEERRQEVERLDASIEAKCVGHIVFARDRMAEFVQLIEDYAKPRLQGHGGNNRE